LTLENLSPDGKKKGKTTKESLVLLAARNCHVVYTFDFYKNVRTYRFSGVPVCEGHRPPSRHPEKAALFSLIGAGRPEMFIAETLESKNVLKIFHRTEFYGHKWPLVLNGTHTEFFYVFLQLVVFDLALDAGQLHSVVVTEFGRLVPIGLFVFPFRMAVKERRWKK
jgi:hypothetical protein